MAQFVLRITCNLWLSAESDIPVKELGCPRNLDWRTVPTRMDMTKS